MTSRIFDKKHIILLKINENDLNSFLVDFDIDDNGKMQYQLDELSKSIINTIPEYVFANYEDPSIPQNNAVDKLREAAKSIYKIKDFDLMRRFYLENDIAARNELKNAKSYNRGEFGELILHLLLRDFKGSIPLISKVYFKDTAGVPAHGFDAVHITTETNTLWLGESKFYKDGKRGISDLISDLSHHFKRDYLNDQFTIIKKNLNCNTIPNRDEWINRLNACSKMSEQLQMINIPLLCTYENDIYTKFTDFKSPESISYHESNIRDLKSYFDTKNNHPLRQQLNVILFLFPIRAKKELVKLLHERLWHMQSM